MNQKLRERMEKAAQEMVEASVRPSEIAWQEHKDSFTEGAEWMHSELWPLLEQARKYTNHWKTCDIYFFNGVNVKCSCGYVDFCNRLEQFEKGE